MKTVVITGSARGFGYELAKEFLRNEVNVVISDVNEENLQKAKKEGNKNFFLFTALVALCTALVELIPFVGAMVGCIIALAGYGLFIKLLIDNKK